MKAMLLAAGRGDRLRPLTDNIPKPLIPVGSHRLIEHNLFKLKSFGINEVIINVSYKRKQIMEFLDNGSRYGLNIHYSEEPNGCLGTGGGIQQALTQLGDEPFLLFSADIWSDYHITDLMRNSQSEVHLVMVANPYYHIKGDYHLDSTGFLHLQEPKLTYANIAKINPTIFNHCPVAPFSLSLLFNKAIQAKKASGELYTGPWYNVGTLEELAALKQTFV